MRRPVAGGPKCEAGSGTILMLVASAVVLLAGVLLAVLAAVAVARHRAASAADLAALAAQAHALEGQPAACRAAVAVLSPVGADLVACALMNGVADVRASVRPGGPLGRLGAVTARARASPGQLGPGGGHLPGPTRTAAGSSRSLGPRPTLRSLSGPGPDRLRA